jgi:hypothetical protein
VISAEPEGLGNVARAAGAATTLAVPKIGPVKAGRLLTIARISSSKTVGALSGRQRASPIELLSR